MNDEGITIAAVGDIALMQKPRRKLWTDVWNLADIRLANLEAPIVEYPGPPADKFIRIKQPVEAGEWLQELNITAVSLANNHMMDWGNEGLRQTFSSLYKNEIKFSGAGNNIEEAAKPCMIEVKGYKIAFLSWSSTVPKGFQALSDRAGIASVRIKNSYEIDSNIADEQPGTPPWVHTEPMEEDLQHLEKVIKYVQEDADFIILAIHWGIPPQWSCVYQGPIAEYQVVIAERVARAGVDLVLGHHAHAPYGIETFHSEDPGKQVPVLYSLGNFIFHHEYLPGGFEISEGTLSYLPPQLPENHQSCIAEINLSPFPDVNSHKKLYITKVALHPAMIDKIGEATEASLEDKITITERLHHFSTERQTKTLIDNHALIWQPHW